MAELGQDRWSAADDAVVRGALATLRRDVETLELADVRFVKARGSARRRRTVLTATAAAAAAVLVLGYVGFSGVGRTASLQPAGHSRSTTSTASTGRSTPSASATEDPGLPLPVAGELPVSAEWQRALGITETVVVSDFKESGGGAVPDCANVGEPGTRSLAQFVAAESAGLQGDQRVYTSASTAVADRKADELVSQLLACSSGGAPVKPPKVSIVADSAWPKVFSAVGPASTAWYVVTHAGGKVGLISVIEPGEGGKHRWTTTQVQDIASVAQRRLVGGVGASPATSGGSGSAPVARNESMPVAGTRPLLPSSLFVAASQWSSAAISQGHGTHAVTTDWEGGAAIHECDLDTGMDMTTTAGRFGIVSVADQVNGTFLGKQRVRLMDSPDRARAEAARLGSGVDACARRQTGITVQTNAAHPSIWRVEVTYPGAKPVTTWLAVTTMEGTPEGVTMISVRTPMADADGWAQMDRLVTLARQK